MIGFRIIFYDLQYSSYKLLAVKKVQTYLHNVRLEYCNKFNKLEMFFLLHSLIEFLSAIFVTWDVCYILREIKSPELKSIHLDASLMLRITDNWMFTILSLYCVHCIHFGTVFLFFCSCYLVEIRNNMKDYLIWPYVSTRSWGWSIQ